MEGIFVNVMVTLIFGVLVIGGVLVWFFVKKGFKKIDPNSVIESRLSKTKEERNYESLCRKSELIGRWNMMQENQPDKQLEIYKTEDGYVSVLLGIEIVYENLIKEGDRYKIDNGFDDCYQINDQGEIKLVDSEGEIPGFTFVKILP
jgi:hypothetical protein